MDEFPSFRDDRLTLRKFMTTSIVTSKYEIFGNYDDVAPFLEQVIQAADAHRNALGFLAESVFHDFARRERLLVVTERIPSGHRYVGHLLFRPRYPRAHVLQMRKRYPSTV
jgi:hypothetical protein